MTFRGLTIGSYFRLTKPEFADCRCKKVYEAHYIQIAEHPSNLGDEVLRRTYSDFEVIPMGTEVAGCP